MKLKSKICTSVEQSKKLLELGLKPETSDMHYHKNKLIKWRLETYPLCTKENLAVYKGLVRIDGKQYADEYFERVYGQDIPAWSLSRLIELMPKRITGRKTGISYELDILPAGIEVNYSCLSAGYYVLHSVCLDSYYELHSVCLDGSEATLFDAIIEMIDWLIKKNYFNKEYLCNK